ncbi:hypothetical protein EOC93_08010 [Mesorhizobium sp. M6A.T.Ce.TU.002.03.1.1]|nr:hypothetical protein EOC93_08010 [Mesorhizobium sp. M6A.T.Ce.TU.002.03.1.1]
MIRNDLRWRDVPSDYGPHKTIYNRFIRWSRWVCSTVSWRNWPRRAAKRTI